MGSSGTSALPRAQLWLPGLYVQASLKQLAGAIVLLIGLDLLALEVQTSNAARRQSDLSF